MTMQQKNLYDAVSSLPKEMFDIALDFVRHLRADDGEPPLTDDELLQIEEANEDIAAGNFGSIHDVRRRLLQ